MSTPLNGWQRFVAYALTGVAIEITFTAVWDLVAKGHLTLHGNSHIWAFFIYGVSMLVQEVICYKLLRLGVPLLLRLFVYTLWTYAWEFSTGSLLKAAGICPWDYAPWFDYHVDGLITFEYAPFWFVGGIFYEYVVLATVLKLRLADVSVLDGLHMIVDAPLFDDDNGLLASKAAATTTTAVTSVTRRVGRSPARARR